MKIAVDVDGVLLSLMERFCEVINQRVKTKFCKDHITEWEFFNQLNISEEEAYEIFHLLYEDSKNLPFIDYDAPFYLKELKKKHSIDIVSARDGKFKKELQMKLEFHGIKKGSHYENLILVESKPYDLKVELDYDLFIDDNPNLVEPIKRKNAKYLLLFSQPWNMHINSEKNVIRVDDWEETFNTIKAMD
ncbi:MAG: hypothetical protein BAJALOKI2v1_510008 [Promethearchaeota archaeon]|nr:MAG: hypothetical protein BAJALOKI2v1_510008 [Candidatus Lokiarchaeota archaeon]